MPADERPSSPAQAIKECDEDVSKHQCASQNCMHASSNVLQVQAKCQCFASLKQLHASDDGQGSFVLSWSSACTL